MKKLVYLLAFVAVTVIFQSCDVESTDEQVEIIENAKSEPKPEFHAVDPDEVEDPDDRGNN